MHEQSNATLVDPILMEVVADGRAVPVEFRLRCDFVEVLVEGHQAAVFDRDTLAAWFAAPSSCMVMDDVAWSLDVSRRVVMSLPKSRGWLLAPAVEQLLRDRL